EEQPLVALTKYVCDATALLEGILIAPAEIIVKPKTATIAKTVKKRRRCGTPEFFIFKKANLNII
ncbi:MAG TPA: hypothetical protein VJN71_04260, partial [Nitrososphaerales archaeon]|nr:hypothetical protein [Nitrososphaerales archaeon]